MANTAVENLLFAALHASQQQPCGPAAKVNSSLQSAQQKTSTMNGIEADASWQQ
jgi:hypothetical protein